MLPTDRRVAGTATVLVLAVLSAVLLMVRPASAGPDDVDHQAWLRTGSIGPGSTAEERLYVSSAGGQEQARSFIDLATTQFDVSKLNAASLVLTEAEGGLLPDRAALVACALVTPLADDGELDGRPPEVDCDVTTVPSRSSDGTWDVPLQAFAGSLIAGRASGVAILPSSTTDAVPAFTVVFDVAATQVLVPALDQASEGPTGGAATAPAMSGVAEEPLLPPLTTRSDEVGADVTAPGLAPSVAVPPGRAQPVGPEPEAAGLPATTELAATGVPASSNSARSVLIVALVAVAAGFVLLSRSRVIVPAVGLPLGRAMPAVSLSMPPRVTRKLAVWLALPALVMLLPETAAYKIGVIAIVFVGAIGLHLLVNVAGELSLAHAAFVGIPAFAVAHASAGANVSPILAIPVGILAGIGIGLVVAATALRARGLQVALVTLAVAIGTVQFLFYQEWLIGPPEGLDVPVPSLFGFELESNVARVPVLAAIVALAAAAGTTIIRSKLGRGLSLVRTDPDVAAAAGIPVSLYRAMAYAIAGGFAGLAGSAYVIWVQHVSPQAFPLQLGFTYLLIAALAGRGGLGGVAVSALIVQGGVLFTFLPRSVTLYVAPIALLLQVTRFEGGINASLRALPALFTSKKWRFRMSIPAAGEASTRPMTAVRIPVALGLLMVVAGFTAIGVAWYNTGRTDQLWIQNQEIVSGGLVGLGLIIFGSALLLRDALLYGGSTIRQHVIVEPRVLLDPGLPPVRAVEPDSEHEARPVAAAARKRR